MIPLWKLLHDRVNAAHRAMGAPEEALVDVEGSLPSWTFFKLGYDGVLGIKSYPEIDGDTLVVALPSNGSRLGSKRCVQIMQAWCASGRKLYTSAWEGHHLAIRINRHMGGVVLGKDASGFIHFEHTADSLKNAAARKTTPDRELDDGQEKHS